MGRAHITSHRASGQIREKVVELIKRGYSEVDPKKGTVALCRAVERKRGEKKSLFKSINKDGSYMKNMGLMS